MQSELILKNWKKSWRYYLFTHVNHKWRSYDVWFLEYKGQQTKFFVILGHFLPFWKLDKNTWRNYHFTHKHHKWQSFEFNVWLLRYGARHTEYFVILDCFCSFTPLVWYIFTSSTKNLYMVLMKKQKYNINFYKLFPTYDFS